MTSKNKKIVLAGGCFWCMEAIFAQLKGVEKVIPGYSDGAAISIGHLLCE